MNRPIALIFITIFCNLPTLADKEINPVSWGKFHKEGKSWPTFSYPPFYVLDPRSYTGEEYKWTVILTDPAGKVNIIASPHGWVPEHYRTELGYKSPRDVVLVTQLKGGRRIERDGFEIFVEEGKDYTKAIFLKDRPGWGLCYNTLYISFPTGKSDEHTKMISRVIDSFSPSFVSVGPISDGRIDESREGQDTEKGKE